MGKKTRRKNNNRGNKNKPSSTGTPYQDPSDTTATAATGENASALLQRIRHADPKTRHAALAAVANTLLDPSCLRLHPKVTTTLLAAIRERVMDADLDVCQVAAGCLANCVTILATETSNNNSNNNNSSSDNNKKHAELEPLSAGWTIVLVGRLQQCYQFINAASSDAKKDAKQRKQWLAVAVQCWRALCVLVETNPAAVGRWTSSLDAKPRQDFHQMLLEWLQHGQTWWATATSSTATTSATMGKPVAAGGAQQQQKQSVEEAVRPFYKQILVLAARTLHSAWDDNTDLLLPWKEECPDAFRRAMELLQSIVTINSSSSDAATTVLPIEMQLHATGAILAARSLLTTQQALSVTQQAVLPQLVARLSSFSWPTAQHLLEDYQAAWQKFESEAADDALERDVIRTVQERKEPSRDIAKRQKAKKEEKQQKKQQEREQQQASNNDANTNMEEEEVKPAAAATAEEDNDNAKMEEDFEAKNKQQQQQVETQEALERARQKWNDFLLPLQLSLELLANVSSRGAPDMDGDDNGDDEMMMDDDWGPEQEAQFMQDQQLEQERNQKHRSEDEVFQKALVESALPAQLVHLFRQVYQTPPSTTTSTAMVFPEQSSQDIEDLQSKVTACLGNCWENISFWPLQMKWDELQKAASNAITGIGKEGLVSAMVIALKTRPDLRKEWQPAHLGFWLQHVSGGERTGDADNTAKQQSSSTISIRRDAVTMLSVLCSQEPHPAEVNQQVCSTMLTALTKPSESLLIQCEVLNALMDMYGEDEDDGTCYQSVFESLQVLGHFQRCIPTLKTKLKERERLLKFGGQNDEDGTDRLELEQWKETVLNSSRFVQYKKGLL